MSKAPHRFKLSELQRIIRAVKKEGGGMSVVIAPDDSIRIEPAPSANVSGPLPDADQIVL
jgi:hypothetical protein